MVFAVTQIILALGIAIGFTYLYADIDKQSLLYLATGAPTIAIILIGLVIVLMFSPINFPMDRFPV